MHQPQASARGWKTHPRLMERLRELPIHAVQIKEVKGFQRGSLMDEAFDILIANEEDKMMFFSCRRFDE